MLSTAIQNESDVECRVYALVDSGKNEIKCKTRRKRQIGERACHRKPSNWISFHKLTTGKINCNLICLSVYVCFGLPILFFRRYGDGWFSDKFIYSSTEQRHIGATFVLLVLLLHYGFLCIRLTRCGLAHDTRLRCELGAGYVFVRCNMSITPVSNSNTSMYTNGNDNEIDRMWQPCSGVCAGHTHTLTSDIFFQEISYQILIRNLINYYFICRFFNR